MSLVDWLQERPLLTPESKKKFGHYQDRPRWSCILTGLLALGVLAAVPFIYLYTADSPRRLNLILTTSGFYCYTLLGWLFRPRINYDDVGWAGGMVDDPFSLSDNSNRLMGNLDFVLMPARLLATGISDFFRCFRTARKD